MVAVNCVTAKEPAVRAPVIIALLFTCKSSPIPTPPYTIKAPVLTSELGVELVMVVNPEIVVVKRLELPWTVAPPYKNNEAEDKLLAVESRIEIG